MTEAEKLMKTGLTICLNTNRHGNCIEDYIAEFKPDDENPLQITNKNFDIDDPMGSDAIFLTYESAVELAKFLKRLFIDEASE